MSKPEGKRHITIIGAGAVGSTIAYTLMLKGIASHISMIDVNTEKLTGEVTDLTHAKWDTTTGSITAGDYSDCAETDLVIITAGATQKPGETRLDLATKNLSILRSIISQMGRINASAKVLIVANPVDVLTHFAKQEIPLPPNQIFGAGTYLDTSRMRHELSTKFNVNPNNVHAYVLGEHGDSSFCAWSESHIGGRPIVEITTEQERSDLMESVKRAAYEIMEKKGSTSYGIAVAVSQIVEAVFNDQKLLIPVSTTPPDSYNIHGVCLGIPAIIGINGIDSTWELSLSEIEAINLQTSASKIKSVIDSVS